MTTFDSASAGWVAEESAVVETASEAEEEAEEAGAQEQANSLVDAGY